MPKHLWHGRSRLILLFFGSSTLLATNIMKGWLWYLTGNRRVLPSTSNDGCRINGSIDRRGIDRSLITSSILIGSTILSILWYSKYCRSTLTYLTLPSKKSISTISMVTPLHCLDILHLTGALTMSAIRQYL